MTEKPAQYRAKFKYDEKTARRYFDRKARKHFPEMRLIDRALAFIPKTHRLIDAPCGGGRVTVHLAESGCNVSAADISESMIQIARGNIARHDLKCTVERQDLEKLSFGDCSFDTFVCFRFFHHLPNPEIRSRIVKELCRVASRFVVMSYFNPVSTAALERKFRAWRRGKKLEEYDTPLSEVAGYFSANDFQLKKDFALRALIHNLHLALFERTGETKP
jgi:2-polyprenyl-3-methyl-5-hydroxy-6-metoxy-1,4-benzoquinol methylase